MASKFVSPKEGCHGLYRFTAGFSSLKETKLRVDVIYFVER